MNANKLLEQHFAQNPGERDRDPARTDLLLEQCMADIFDRDQRICELEAALRPFSDFASIVVPADLVITNGSEMAKRQLTMGNCVNARYTLLRSAP